MKTVSAREANQRFSQLLAAAAAGEEIVITRRGVAVARLGPAKGRQSDRRRLAALRRLLRALDVSLGQPRYRRDELYER